jgi:hypothetical protein
VFNQTDDHIIDSNIELSPSQIYDQHIQSTLSKEETKAHIDKLIAAKQETSIEKIKRKYLNTDLSDDNNVQSEAHQYSKPQSTNKENQKASYVPNVHIKKPSNSLKKKPSFSNISRPPAKVSRQSSITNKSVTRAPTAKRQTKVGSKPTKANITQAKQNSKSLYNEPQNKSLSDLFTLIRMHAQNCNEMRLMLEANGFSV